MSLNVKIKSNRKMRHYLKAIIVSAVSFYTAYTLVPTIKIGQDPKNILLLIGGIFIISQIINPIFSLVLLPINHLTFGLVMFVLNAALFFALLNYLPGFVITPYDFAGASIAGIILPPMNFDKITTIVLAAAIITIVQKILHIIFE
ncbi:hypothetical protein A3D81_02120 [Candidatus Curtissbacteria bacterium RIFCSPHIGHO2_02_FULL_40_17]|uniref:Uncharacterized protein n=4 Tax=Candidatus Curtissiibacteriota TaxID=1752717 RepID=A0A1F5GGV9_9BACT|nr:MAG: hypothetical protein A2693_01625 [Candidatus Curtissbacteria bacterium RIFCSPHIGHO2_01_FULL_40_12]OGD91085.1 MAG: hypothetical protein A3D81_02120 [Candidatus Curtissbacteria bacterium RIFCSPHIGHO2_02_FULL_40_17]OGE07101.1 MAG: hypothetical protein A3I53_02790 [Candidatus Curtissbacteria bacterium RIFCSPLOWO2_02_FULL_40_13b]